MEDNCAVSGPPIGVSRVVYNREIVGVKLKDLVKIRVGIYVDIAYIPVNGLVIN